MALNWTQKTVSEAHYRGWDYTITPDADFEGRPVWVATADITDRPTVHLARSKHHSTAVLACIRHAQAVERESLPNTDRIPVSATVRDSGCLPAAIPEMDDHVQQVS